MTISATDKAATKTRSKKRHRKEESAEESEVLEDFFLNAPSLLPQLPTIPPSASRPSKRRRTLRAPLRLSEEWQISVKEIFRIREAPEPCRETFRSVTKVVTQASTATGSAASDASGSFMFGTSAAIGAIGASGASTSPSIFGASAGSSGASSGGCSGALFGATAGASPAAFGGAFGAGASAFGAAPPSGQPSMFAQAFQQQSRPGPGGARRRRR